MSFVARKETTTAVTITAECTNFNKRKATCEISMHVPGDEDAFWHLVVIYDVFSESLFKSPIIQKNRHHQSLQYTISAVDGYSPYAQFEGLDPSSFKILWHSKEDKSIFTTASLPPIAAHQCLGHFDGNHALPIAFLASFMVDLIGQSVATLSGVDVPFKKEKWINPGEVESAASSSSSPAESTTLSCGGIIGEKGKLLTAPFIQVLKWKMEARKLVYADTDGIVFFVEIAATSPTHPHHHPHDPNGITSSFSNNVVPYSVRVVVASSNSKKKFVLAKVDATCVLHHEP